MHVSVIVSLAIVHSFAPLSYYLYIFFMSKIFRFFFLLYFVILALHLPSILEIIDNIVN